MNSSVNCPCGSGKSIDACCSRWHKGEPAPTPEALMRSRYAAFVLCNERYLLDTWHHSTRPNSISFDSKQKWLGLKIVEAKDDQVEFIARYKIGGASAERLHERSRFTKEGDRWFYVDGTISQE